MMQLPTHHYSFYFFVCFDFKNMSSNFWDSAARTRAPVFLFILFILFFPLTPPFRASPAEQVRTRTQGTGTGPHTPAHRHTHAAHDTSRIRNGHQNWKIKKMTTSGHKTGQQWSKERKNLPCTFGRIGKQCQAQWRIRAALISFILPDHDKRNVPSNHRSVNQVGHTQPFPHREKLAS